MDLYGQNIVTLTDSYKFSQWPLYPKKAQYTFAYFEARRGGMFPKTVFFGLHILLQLLKVSVTHADVDEAKEICDAHMGPGIFNEAGWRYIVDKHGGKLPVRIKAVPEGTVVEENNVLMTVENTDPECYWLPNYLETYLSQVWYPMTVATLSREMKRLILSYLKETGDPSLIDFKLHDFGVRGASSMETAAIGGTAHLVNFKGTDNVPALILVRRIYKEMMAGFSIPATEHSNITSWTREGEADAYANVVKTYGDRALYACVSDSYDVYGACRDLWGGKLKAMVLEAKGTLVVRPDSGTPHEVVVKCLDILGERFGYTYNDKRYKILNPKVRLIQGDGINYEETRKIMECMKQAGWSVDNVAFGMGGALLQKDIHRDTQRCAFKCSYMIVDGHERDVYKSPVTDHGKHSKRGRLYLLKKEDGTFVTKVGTSEKDILQVVFENGVAQDPSPWPQICERASVGL